MKHRIPSPTSTYGFVSSYILRTINFDDADVKAKTLLKIFASVKHPVLLKIVSEIEVPFNAVTSNIVSVGFKGTIGLGANVLELTYNEPGFINVGEQIRYVCREPQTLFGSVTGNPAAGTLTLAENAADTNTVTIGGVVYTFQTTLTDVVGNVLIGALATDSIDNLIAAINHAPGQGTLYAMSTVIDPNVSAAVGAGDTMTVTAKIGGITSNDITTTDTLAGASAFGAATLQGGSDPSAGKVNFFIELCALDVPA